MVLALPHAERAMPDDTTLQQQACTGCFSAEQNDCQQVLTQTIHTQW